MSVKRSRGIRNVVLGAILAVVLAVAALEAGVRRDERKLAQRLAHIDRALATAQVTREDCTATSECQCHVKGVDDTFEGCSIVAGHLALWIRSNDSCFKQWVAIDSTWAWDGSAERVAMLWISERPRVVTPKWRVLAVAPCLD